MNVVPFFKKSSLSFNAMIKIRTYDWLKLRKIFITRKETKKIGIEDKIFTWKTINSNDIKSLFTVNRT